MNAIAVYTQQSSGSSLMAVARFGALAIGYVAGMMRQNSKKNQREGMFMAAIQERDAKIKELEEKLKPAAIAGSEASAGEGLEGILKMMEAKA
eukprot:CAMPEP_0184716736 /NCGR_PEP_ID=MMETSP0314-20130426/6404_1 /TAXON_ID=38298 /ORGANISM="Rhodella maculata, Strain CCMP 736" /LENGTH=92 /DNA_ID=CAMNT_0027180199 /DNA_START=81 /DNA_END=359 /DNA_ORIENTATION=-